MDITREQEAKNFRRVSEQDKQWLRDFVQAIKELDAEEAANLRDAMEAANRHDARLESD